MLHLFLVTFWLCHSLATRRPALFILAHCLIVSFVVLSLALFCSTIEFNLHSLYKHLSFEQRLICMSFS